MNAPRNSEPSHSDPAEAMDPGPTRHRVSDTEAGERVDRCLAAAFPELSRSRIKALIEQGNLRLTKAPGSPAASAV
jgi:23S rRNA-/tRNA-specific pseudouridylate synthase